MIRLAFADDIAEQLNARLLRPDRLEDGAFCLVRQGRGHRGTRLLVTEVIWPPGDAWEVQEGDMLRPSAKWISAAISRAVAADSGLLFVHSHPDPRFPAGLSYADMSSFRALAPVLSPTMDGPFGALVVHPLSWAGVVWHEGRVTPIDRIMSVGRTLTFLGELPAVADTPLDARQLDALGVVHRRLRTLSVAIVGSGGLGSPMAEQLVRMGVTEVVLVDNDLLDTESNARRIHGVRVTDINTSKPFPKVEVVGAFLDGLGFGVSVQPVKADVRTERGFRRLLDADVVLCATDTHSSRAVVNELASTYLLPVIDVGVRVSAKTKHRLSGLVAEVRVLTPDTPCLWCRNTISANVIREENLPPHERAALESEGYVTHGIGAPVPSVTALTVLGSSLATTALLALLSEEGKVVPSGYVVDGFMGDALKIGPDSPRSDCRCRSQRGLGDASAPPFIVEE